MTVRGRLLFCSTLKDSFSILWIGESRQSIKAMLSDPKPRFSTTHYLAEDGESIVADKEGQLVGLIADGIPPFCRADARRFECSAESECEGGFCGQFGVAGYEVSVGCDAGSAVCGQGDAC
jgi:hypothetical protein